MTGAAGHACDARGDFPARGSSGSLAARQDGVKLRLNLRDPLKLEVQIFQSTVQLISQLQKLTDLLWLKMSDPHRVLRARR
jgi:hypothetical protein